jgi:hypothetical protein
MRQAIRLCALAAGCVCVVACGGVDRQKFDGVYKAGNALQAEVQSSGGAGSASRDRLKQFDTEVDALRDRTIGAREVEALKAYAEAADAYRYFLRFRAIEPDPENGAQIVLKGPNIEIAARYKLPIDSRNGSKWVNRGQAMTILLQAGDQHLSDGNRIVHGQ